MKYGNYGIVIQKEAKKISAQVTNELTGENELFSSTDAGVLVSILLNNLVLDKEAEGDLLEDIKGNYS
ncbi:hypothetical protein WFM99_05305 [Yersinia enterocolitica]